MEKIIVITNDETLKREMEALLPRGVAIEEDPSVAGATCLFVDIDTMKPSVVRDLSGRNLVVALTKQKRTEPIMEATTFGAYEVMSRPLAAGELLRLLDEVRSLVREMAECVPLKHLPPTSTCVIVGDAPIIMDVCKKLARLSQVEAPVLITGETGTGKELIAESIAQLSSRFGKPFVVVNCAAVPEPLLESELFGFERGSFTGAVASKEGMLKIADEGTVFFDEVGELPLPLQGKLLRFLQTQTFYPIGSTKEVQVDVRVISATNRDLAGMVREGTFREDLYHRLRVTTIHAPPLRDRRKDIPLLVSFFMDRYRHTAPRPLRGVTRGFLEKLTAHDWPGNIRELENTVRSAIALSRTDCLTTLDLKELGESAFPEKGAGASLSISSVVVPYLKQALQNREKNLYDKLHREVDRAALDYVLSRTGENQSEAARLLGISRLTLRKKLG
jgi:DNA-binding NtrC family response regulator